MEIHQGLAGRSFFISIRSMSHCEKQESTEAVLFLWESVWPIPPEEVMRAHGRGHRPFAVVLMLMVPLMAMSHVRVAVPSIIRP